VFSSPMHPYTRMLLAATPLLEATQRKAAVVVKGEPPSPIDPPVGCVFASRCPYVTDICLDERPMLRQFGSGRVACHHAETIG
jgi:dipeptide transport system ATP-binding protein